jgi:hypothetical protein
MTIITIFAIAVTAVCVVALLFVGFVWLVAWMDRHEVDDPHDFCAEADKPPEHVENLALAIGVIGAAFLYGGATHALA